MQEVSKNSTFYASETILLRMSLHKRTEQTSLSGIDIVLEIVTSQLGPRRYASSFAKTPNENLTNGVKIMRSSNMFYVQLSPEFLQTLPSGFLIITAHYKTKSGFITNRVNIGRFVNDMPIEPFQTTDGENAACSFIKNASVARTL